MFRTEVVTTKNIKRALIFRLFNAIAMIVAFTFLALSLNIFGKENEAAIFFRENYNNIIQPIFMVFIVILVAATMYMRTMARTPKRLGYLEMNDTEIKFMVEDEVKEVICKRDLESIQFEYFSMPMRQNPVGSMNYLTLNTKSGQKKFEIVIENSLLKAELGDMLKTYSENIPVKVTYTNFIQKIIGDRDLKM